MKSVLVHECFDASVVQRVSFVTVDARLKKFQFVRMPNVACSCRKRVSYAEREDMLGREDVLVLIPFGSEFPDWRHVVALRKKARTNAQSITFRNIQSAYVNGERNAVYHQERIEAYGASTQVVFFELGAELREARIA